jgi:hypothetical protein
VKNIGQVLAQFGFFDEVGDLDLCASTLALGSNVKSAQTLTGGCNCH